MKIERLPNTAVVTQVRHMSIDGIEFVVPSDFESLIDELCDADGMSNAVRVYNHAVREAFLKAKLIDTNARGGCYGTEKLKKNRQKLVGAYLATVLDARLREPLTVVLQCRGDGGVCPVWALSGEDAGQRAEAWVADMKTRPEFKGPIVGYDIISGVAFNGDGENRNAKLKAAIRKKNG